MQLHTTNVNLSYMLTADMLMEVGKTGDFLTVDSCTGSTFNRLCGLSRSPVAHTCGALELPCSYSSYPEFCAELDNGHLKS